MLFGNEFNNEAIIETLMKFTCFSLIPLLLNSFPNNILCMYIYCKCIHLLVYIIYIRIHSFYRIYDIL